MAAPREFFHSCYHRFLCLADNALQQSLPAGARAGAPEASSLSVYVENDPDTDRQLCARAMAEVYSVHAAVIGMCTLGGYVGGVCACGGGYVHVGWMGVDVECGGGCGM